MLCSRALALGLMTAIAVTARPAAAQQYPAQNISVVVAFAAGGIADLIARLIGQKLSERVSKSVVIENRGGAGGNLAARVVAKAQPDGYTLLATTTALAVNDTVSRNKGYETNELRAVAIVAISPDVLAVHPSNPAKDLKQFLANATKRSFTYGSAGVGTAPHIGAEFLFREVAKVQSVHVPFTGGAPAVNAAVGNHVNALVLTLPTVTPHIVQGRLRGLGLASQTRNSAVPDVPTYGEMGIPNVYSGSWVGFFAPAKTPQSAIEKLNIEINQALKQADVQQRLKSVGFDPIFKSLAETDAYFKGDVTNWGKMVRAVGLAAK
ncbi:MAG: Bug family tripartite tricarboxylate transporter substrate binding protein [Xanthobacteraceae bacterium]